jgi:uncharacterized protein (TIGR02996 family)
MTDEQATFENALDETPAAWELRRIYADWLEENGFEILSTAQRWMARHEKKPGRVPGPGPGYWTWVEELNSEQCEFMHNMYNSRDRAEYDLGLAIELAPDLFEITPILS